jgi:hypothetical protein
MHPDGGVLVAANHEHWHGQCSQPWPQSQSGHGTAAAQGAFHGIAGDVL